MKNSMKSLLTASALSVLGLLNQSASADNSAPERRIVNLQAEAVREVANDEMQATLYSELNDKDAGSLANKINRLLNQTTLIAKRYPSVKIKTGNQNTYPVYDNKQKLQNWRGRAEVVLTSQDFKQASQLVAELQHNLLLENISFNVSEKQRKQVEDELLIEVSQNFQRRAQILLAPWNATKYELINLQINSSGGYRPMPMMATMVTMQKSADAPVEGQNYQSGNSEVRMTANGSIQLQ